jgi:hypothetical protein
MVFSSAAYAMPKSVHVTHSFLHRTSFGVDKVSAAVITRRSCDSFDFPQIIESSQPNAFARSIAVCDSLYHAGDPFSSSPSSEVGAFRGEK